ncbi:hypothetical protein F4780DRAFT_779166 [Xylariomycetidae sp. FL0641]|nr:hypothetical protein F4780DRAFT_779166 [Xylariomycetidae sp. FL0641]
MTAAMRTLTEVPTVEDITGRRCDAIVRRNVDTLCARITANFTAGARAYDGLARLDSHVAVDEHLATTSRRTGGGIRHTTKYFPCSSSEGQGDKDSSNIEHANLHSRDPLPLDKAFDRVFLDVATVTDAGIQTAASVLRILARLHAGSDDAGLTALERLPYFAVLLEGLRPSLGVAARRSRSRTGL